MHKCNEKTEIEILQYNFALSILRCDDEKRKKPDRGYILRRHIILSHLQNVKISYNLNGEGLYIYSCYTNLPIVL